MATMKDIAKLAGVSKATVSHVINNTRFVSEEIRVRVMDIINELGYQPSQVARSLKVKKTKTIAFIIQDSSNTYYNEICKGIESICYKNGYSIIICNPDGNWDKEQGYINTLIKKQVDGIVGDFISNDDKLIEILSNIKIPVMIMNREFDGYKTDYIAADDFQGGYLATKYLLNQGHKKIACITAPVPKSHNVNKRLLGFKAAFKEMNIEYDDSLIIRSYFHIKGGYDCILSLMERKNKPTAAVFYSDIMAIGALSACGRLNIKVPDDFSIIGYDDIEQASYTYPKLTTVSNPKYEMGVKIAETLINRINNKDLDYKKEVLSTSLIIRESCREFKK